MTEEVFIRVVRDDKRSFPNYRRPTSFWTSCAWSGSGRHEFEEGTAPVVLERYGPYRYCRRCGEIVPTTEMPKRAVNAGRIPKAKSSRSMIQACFDRDTGGESRCFYCGKLAFLDTTVLDHFIPRSRGGADALENLRASCVSCDRNKAALMPWEFMPDRFPLPSGQGSRSTNTSTQ